MGGSTKRAKDRRAAALAEIKGLDVEARALEQVFMQEKQQLHEKSWKEKVEREMVQIKADVSDLRNELKELSRLLRA